VSTIGDYAFMEFENLSTLIIPDTIKKVGKNAFAYCNSLRSITVGSKVNSIESNAFTSMSLTNIIFKEPQTWYVYKKTSSNSGTSTLVTITNNSFQNAMLYSEYADYDWSNEIPGDMY